MKYLILNPVIARFHPSEGGNKYPTHPSPHPTQFSQRSPAEAATSYPLPQFSQRAPAEAATSNPPTQYSTRSPAEVATSNHPTQYSTRSPAEVATSYPLPQFSQRAPAEAATSNPLTQYSQRTPAAEAKGSLNPLTYVRNIISAVSLKRPRGVVSSKQELSKQTKNESR